MAEGDQDRYANCVSGADAATDVTAGIDLRRARQKLIFGNILGNVHDPGNRLAIILGEARMPEQLRKVEQLVK